MGRTWMIAGKKGDLEYDAGLAEFYDFVRKNVKDKSSMACPCDMCRNIRYMSFEDVRIHLEKTNFNPKYSRWIFHGESNIIHRMEENVDVQFGEIQKETWLIDDEDPDESNSSQWTMDLKLLETEARVLKASGTMINVEIDEHILHNKQICNLSYEELVHLLDEAKIGASHITHFMRYLSDLTETMESTSSYGFLCPYTLSPYSTVCDENYRSDYIARAMTCTGCGRGRKLIFAPYVEGEHWMLGVINSAQSIIYWCDPAGYEEPRQFFVDTITKAFDKRNSIDPLAGYEARELVWKKIKCPTQPFGTVLCGYYICRYMLEIIRGRYVTIIPNFMLKAPKTYALEQIDEVRDIWANFALQFKPKISDDEV